MENNKGQVSGTMLGVVISTIVAVIIGIVAIAVVDDEVSKQTEAQSVTDEAITGSNSTAVQLENTDLSANATCNCSPFTADLTAGTILHTNDTCNGQTVLCSYSYYDAAYADSATTRTVVDLTPTIWAVVLLSVIAAGMIMRFT